MAKKELLENQVRIASSKIVLDCRPVASGVLQTLLSELATLEGVDITDPGTILLVGGSQQAQAIQASEKLFTYCTGWGVSNEPPQKLSEVAQLMGVRPDQPNLKRAAWIRYDLGATQQELGDVVGIVMGLTFTPSDNGKEE